MISKSDNNSYHDGARAFVQVFFSEKDQHLNALEHRFSKQSKFVIAFVRLILEKVAVNGFTRSRRKIDGRYEFGLKVILKVH